MFGLWELERPEAAASWWIQTAYCLCSNADFVLLNNTCRRLCSLDGGVRLFSFFVFFCDLQDQKCFYLKLDTAVS